MQPGTWAELTTTNMVPTLAQAGGASTIITAYSDDAVWDPVTKRFFFIGGDHFPINCDPRFVSYSDATNAWQILPQPTWFPCGAFHGYNHTALDPVNGKLYHRQFNLPLVHKYDIASGVWSVLPSIPSNVVSFIQCCVGVAWFPERQSLVYVSSASETVAEYSEQTGTWGKLAQNLPIGAYQNFAKYNPVHNVVLFGGGQSDRHMYKLDASGNVTALHDAPIPIGIMNTIITPDPVSGKYLIFGNAKDFWVYDVVSDTWTQQSGQAPIYDPPVDIPAVFGTIVAPISTYGVNMFARCHISNCHVYLYKHYSDNTPPVVSISSPAASSTVSGTITVTADASDVDGTGVAGVQFKLDGNNLGAEDTTAPYSVSLDTTTLLSGSHSFSAVARDLAGNQATSASVPATVTNSIPFNFNLAVGSNLVMTQGQSRFTTVTATAVAGTIEQVTFSVTSGLPSGTSANFSPVACNPNCVSTMTITSSGSTPPGSYSVNVNGASATGSKDKTFMLTISPLNPTFADKCGQYGVMNCFGFDNTTNLYYNWPTGTVCDVAFSGQTNYNISRDRTSLGNTEAVVQNGECVYPQIDTAASHSGAGSMKFRIPSQSGPDSGGFFSETYKPKNPDGSFSYIGPGSPLGNVLYFQFYQKFDANFLNTNFQCVNGDCGGFKQAIWFGNPPNGTSSSSIEVTMFNGFQRNVPQVYGQQGADVYGVQDVIGCTFAAATSQGGSGSGASSRPNYSGPLNPNCIHYEADQWMEFTGRIEIRGDVTNLPASRVQLWVNGNLAVDYGSAKVNWGGTDGSGFGQFLISPYHTNKNPNQVHPEGTTSYDDLIVSTEPIPMANGSIPTPDTTPPSITSVAVSNVSSTGATITWTTNKPADSQVDYGLTTSYGLSTVLNPALVTSHSVSLTGLNGSTTYHYRVKSRDVGGNPAESIDFTFTTQPPADVIPPVISSVAASSVTSLDAVISWLTDEASNSQVEFGLTTAYGSQTTINAALVTGHSQVISGLNPNTLYNYRVKSRDAAGNLQTSLNYTFTTPSTGAPPTSGLIGYWPLDEPSGATTADSSGNNKTGTLLNTPARVTGQVGNALQFSPPDRINVPRVNIGTDFDVASLPFTVSAWVNPVDYTDWRAIFSKRNSFSASAMRFDFGLSIGTGRVYLDSQASNVTFTYAPPLSTWTHLSVVATATGTQLFVNGALLQTFPPLTLGTGATANTAIGGTGELGGSADTDPFKGMIDEVRVYNRVLSSAEVQSIYYYPGPLSTTDVASSNITSTGASITWTTNRAADSQVDYGTTSSYGQTTTLDTTMVTSHSVVLSGLSANTEYHYRVRSRDSQTILSTSGDYTFTTISPLNVSPGAIQSAIAGVAYSQTISASGGVPPYTYSLLSGALPPGLSLNPSTGAITGTPTTTGSGNFTVRATDSTGNTGSRPYTVGVSNVVSSNVSMILTGKSYLGTPSPGFAGRLSLEFALINNGPPITSPMYFQLTQLSKINNDDNPEQPNMLLSADDGFGLTGDFQSVGISSLATGQMTPVVFLVGMGSRQAFAINVELYTGIPGNPLTGAVYKDNRRTFSSAGAASSQFRFQISGDAVSDLTSGPLSNMGVITGAGSQSRPSVAVDPNVPTRMAVASTDYAARAVRVNTSEDGGRTWRSTVLSRSVLNQTFYTGEDPSVAYDSLGRLSVVYVLSNVDNSTNAVVISESNDGLSFSPPSAIAFHAASERIIDSRPAISIRSGVGRYVAWDSFSTATNRYSIKVAQSAEGGLFGAATTVISNAQVSSPALALGRNVVYLGWDEWGFNSVAPYKTGGRLMIAASASGGALAFGTPREIARTGIGFGLRIPAMPELGVGPNLSLAVDPKADERVNVVFADKGKGIDIRFANSTDYGNTWQTATVNDDAGLADQFSPAIAVDSDSNVNISFYDTRLSNTFQSADVFLARPTSGNGFTNQRLTTVASNDSRTNPLRNSTSNLGDRTSIATMPGGGVIAWTDTRLGSEDIFLSVVALAPPIPPPSVPTITWNTPAAITYGTPLGTPELSAFASAAGTLVYNPPAGTILNAGSGRTLSVTFTPADPVRFTATSATVQIDVLQAPLTVAANSVSVYAGSADPPLTGTIAGLVNNDNITAAYIASGTSKSLPADYPITPVLSDPQNRLPNYKVALLNGTFRVIANSKITWNNPVSIAYGTPLAATQLNATASTPGTFAYNPPPGTVLSAGNGQTLSVTFTPADAAHFTTESANVKIDVVPSPLTVTAASLSRPYGSPNPPLTGAIAGVVTGDNITASYSTLATPGGQIGNYLIVPALNDPNNRLANYSVSLLNGVLEVLPAPLTVTANSVSRIYGAANPAFTGSITGVVNGDSITATYTTTATAASGVGSYPITPKVAAADNQLLNYKVNLVNGALNVLPAPLTVTAGNSSRMYGSPNPAFTGSFTGLLNGDTITAKYITAANAASPVGNYPITPVVNESNKTANYTVNLVNGSLSILPVPLAVRANSTSRMYGSANPVMTGSISGILNGDNITAAYTTNATVSSMPGNYSIVPVMSDPNLRLPNYKVTMTNGVLTVVPAPIASLSTTNVSFGSGYVLSKSKAVTLTVNNSGTADLSISRVAVGGGNAADFAVDNDCERGVKPGKECTITVTFIPLGLTARAAVLTLTDNSGGAPGSQQVVTLSGQGVMNYAVYATGDNCAAITLSGTAFTDSYDSSQGIYAKTKSNTGGDVGVNGNINLKGDALVKGTIYAPNPTAGSCRNGTPGITIQGGDARASGGYAPLAAPVAFITPMPVTSGEADIKLRANKTLPPGKYEDVTVDGRVTLTLSPGIYSFNSLRLKNRASITLAPGGPVIIFIAGKNTSKALDLDGGDIQNPSGIPSNLILVHSGTDNFELSGGADLYGVLYAPNADVKLSGKAQWYGAMVVRSLDVSSDSAIHYDRDLGR